MITKGTHSASRAISIHRWKAGQGLPSLFGPTPDDVKLAIGRLAAPNRFAALARDFFARLTTRYLDYFLSREISNHVGPGRGLNSIDDHTAFNGDGLADFAVKVAGLATAVNADFLL